MRLKKRGFETGYDKKEFYSIMGQYFAERDYRKEMPYMVNTEMKQWVLYYNEEELVSFYAYEKKKHFHEITGFYVVKEYRNKGIGKKMVKDIMDRFTTARLTTNAVFFIKTLEKVGFSKIREKGSYAEMEWRKKDDTR